MALEGYEYQLNVSVLVALQLMLISNSATQVTLEPANNEDLEADFEPATPRRVQAGANIAESYKLVVQVKLRNSGPWSIGDFNRLLNHGVKRQPAKHHLDDPGTRYLLITNADASGVARDLLVCGLEEWPEDRNFPTRLSKTLPHKPEGRIAIWGVLTERQLELEVNDILGSLLRVPQSRQEECRNQLRDEAIRRMQGTCPGEWTREDLLSVIRDCGGYLASAPELESFVAPLNYPIMKNLLQQRNALVIAGPSGTGKTLTALNLIDQAQQRPSPPEIIVVKENEGPSSTRKFSATGPKLFYIEDPWGQYSLRSGAESWTVQLPRLLGKAHAGHQYVITSRTDMLIQARAVQNLERWTVVLDADQYLNGELATIYDNHLDRLATDLQAHASDFRMEALDTLETPLEVDLFFSHLADGPKPNKVSPAFFRRIRALAHRDAVEEVVSSYLSNSDPKCASAIIWALLAARSQFDRSQLASVIQQLRKSDSTAIDGLEKLVIRLIATRHLRQPSQAVSFSHPSVRAGIEEFIKEHWKNCKVVLKSLIFALTQLSGHHREWGFETAARSLQVIANFISGTESFDAEFEADSASHQEIDAWLEEGLVDPQSDFGSMLRLASDVGTKESTLSELARWFIKGIGRAEHLFLDNWEPLTFDDAWYARVSADPRTFAIADRFVRELLPQDSNIFDNNLVSKLDRIAAGLTPAFVAAARRMIDFGYVGNLDVVATGAVRNLNRYKEVLDAALDELERLRRYDKKEGKEQRRAIEDGEYDEAFKEDYESHHQDIGYAANLFVEVYVNRVRSLDDWCSLAKHSRKSELCYAWATDILKSKEPVSPKELQTVIAVSRFSDDEDRAWKAGCQHWHPSLESDLKQRILLNPDDDRLRAELICCALMKTPKMLTDCVEQLSNTPAAFVQLLVDVRLAHHQISNKEYKRGLQPLMESISSVDKEIFEALSIDDNPPRPVGQTALTLMNEAAKTVPAYILDKIVPVLIVSGLTPSTAIRKWLDETEDHQLAKAATEAAICIRDDDLVRLSLGHARADARAVALTYLAKSSSVPMSHQLLKMASDPSSRVRSSLVDILVDRPHTDHLDVLLRLIDDKWSDAEPFRNDRPSYPIAREAVIGLAAYGKLSDHIGEVLLLQAENTDDRSLSIVALETAANCCGPTIRKKIWRSSLIDQPRWVSVDAINALTQTEVVEKEILNSITTELLLQLPPPASASACVLLAHHGQVNTVVEAMERIAYSKKRRALLLLGVNILADRERDVAIELLKLLGSDHPACRLLDLAEDEQLPSRVLDDLGHVQIRKAVQVWLNDKIAK